MNVQNIAKLALVSTLALLASTAFAGDNKIKSGDGLVFGGVTILGIGSSGYELTLRRITDRKRVPISLDRIRAGEPHFRFSKSLKPGRYYLESAQSPQVDWQNRITDSSKFFDVEENVAVFIGEWTLTLKSRTSNYSVIFPITGMMEFMDSHRDVKPLQWRTALLGRGAILTPVDSN